MSKKIVLTGGGTAGHITPNIALLPRLSQLGYEISYIGSYNGMEKKLIEDYDIPYYGISTGKFRRYFDLKNFTGSLSRYKGIWRGKKIFEGNPPGHYIFQRRFCIRPCSPRSILPEDSLCYPRIRYDTGTR